MWKTFATKTSLRREEEEKKSKNYKNQHFTPHFDCHRLINKAEKPNDDHYDVIRVERKKKEIFHDFPPQSQ